MSVSPQVQNAMNNLSAELTNLDEVQQRLEALSARVAQSTEANANEIVGMIDQLRDHMNQRLNSIYALIEKIESIA